jgi:hypothetical protein
MQGGTAWYGKKESSRRLSDEEQFPDPPLAPAGRDRRGTETEREGVAWRRRPVKP